MELYRTLKRILIVISFLTIRLWLLAVNYPINA